MSLGFRARSVRRAATATAALAVAVSGLIAVGGASTTAAAAPSVPTAPYGQCSDTTGTPYATGLSPLPCLPYPPSGGTRWTDNGQLLLTQGPANLFVGERRLARLFTLICGNSGSPSSSCPAALSGPLPPAETSAVTVVEKISLQSQAGAAAQYGELARVPVDQETSAGRVKGTLVLAQGTSRGVVVPVLARQTSATPLYNPGDTVAGFEKFGPNPGPGPAQVLGDVAGSGPATATISGLTVDGAAVDAGSCRATGTLSVSARGGWAVGDAVEGEPAEYRPFEPPSYLHAALGNVGVQGCEGLDPAVTQVLVDNTDFLQQVTLDFTVGSFSPYGCLTGVTPGCFDRHPAVVNPARVPATL